MSHINDMSHINRGTKLQIKKHMKEFLDSLPVKESSAPNDRDLSFYLNLLGLTFDTFCSSPTGMYFILKLPGGFEPKSRSDLEDNIHEVVHLALSPRAKKAIQKTLRKKSGISMVYVVVDGRATKKSYAHATLLVFDGSTGKQHFFDPSGSHKSWLQQTMAIRPPFVEGFKVANEKEDSWPRFEKTLQHQFDQTGIRDGGANCGVWVFMVATLCLRFGIGDPKFIATLLMSVSTNQKSTPGSFTRRMWTWMGSMQTPVRKIMDPKVKNVQRDAAVQQLTKQIFRPDSTTICGAYCPTSDTVCTRKACPEDIFCWQHRFSIRNKDKRGKNKMKCSATQVKCR